MLFKKISCVSTDAQEIFHSLHIPCRGDHCVKGDMVYSLSEDMVYTLVSTREV